VYVGCEGRLWALAGARDAALWRPGDEPATEAGQSEAGQTDASAPASGPVTHAQARSIADMWSATGHAAVYEFDLGYVVYDVAPAPQDQSRPPSNIGAGRGVIDKQTGELTVWPSMPPEVVAQMYREHRGSS
jgi:hypothetical protein